MSPTSSPSPPPAIETNVLHSPSNRLHRRKVPIRANPRRNPICSAVNRAHQPTLYAVRYGAALLLRFVDFDEGRLTLRPYSREFPVQLLPLANHESPADYLIGRVCFVLSEL